MDLYSYPFLISGITDHKLLVDQANSRNQSSPRHLALQGRYARDDAHVVTSTTSGKCASSELVISTEMYYLWMAGCRKHIVN